MFIRPFDTIIWHPDTSFQTFIVEDHSGNLYRHTDITPGIHITDVENWVSIDDAYSWYNYLELMHGGARHYDPTVQKTVAKVSEKIRNHFNPPVPERSQGETILEIIETLLEEAIESRDDDPQVINGYAIGYDDGKVAGLRTALRNIKEFLD